MKIILVVMFFISVLHANNLHYIYNCCEFTHYNNNITIRENIDFNYDTIRENIDFNYDNYADFTPDEIKHTEYLLHFVDIDKDKLKKHQILFNQFDDNLVLFIKKYPFLIDDLNNAAGYGIFTTSSINIVLYAGGWGRGIVIDNEKKEALYVDTARVGTGIGLGYINEITLIIFKKHFAIEQYIGAQVGGDVNASLTLLLWTKSISFNPTITTYKMYQSGANIQANWGATVYWQQQ